MLFDLLDERNDLTKEVSSLFGRCVISLFLLFLLVILLQYPLISGGKGITVRRVSSRIQTNKQTNK